MMKSLIKKLSFAGGSALLLTIALPGAAQAVPLTLVQVAGGTVGPQSATNPCIIAATTCQQPATMGYNNFVASGGDSDYNMYSTTPTAVVADGVQGTPYTVGQLETALGSSAFIVGIDVNTTSAASETLRLFEVIINGSVAYSYVGAEVIGVASSNGNGFADWALGTIDLSGYADGATVLFHAVWDNAVDGGESFFLVGTEPDEPLPAVPEPATMSLLGLGLFGAAAARRRARRAL